MASVAHHSNILRVRPAISITACAQQMLRRHGNSTAEGRVDAIPYFLTAVLRVAEKRVTADAVIMDRMVQFQRKEKGGKKKGRARPGRVDGQRKKEEAQTLWRMLYADDAGIVSRSTEGLEKIMTVIVTACAAFGLTVGGQDGDRVPADERWRARAVSYTHLRSPRDKRQSRMPSSA